MAEERKTCAVIGSAPIGENPFEGRDRSGFFVICADGGYDSAAKFSIVPDLLIGDFDSLQGSLPENIPVIRLKVEKDDTDMFAAVREGVRRGFRSFELFGALGGKRMDHSFANFCTLQYLAGQGCRAVIADGSRRVFLLNGGRLMLNGLKGRTVSVFPFGCSSCTVSYTGLKYPLDNALLEPNSTLGTSNSVSEDRAQIVVSSGNAIVFLEP